MQWHLQDLQIWQLQVTAVKCLKKSKTIIISDNKQEANIWVLFWPVPWLISDPGQIKFSEKHHVLSEEERRFIKLLGTSWSNAIGGSPAAVAAELQTFAIFVFSPWEVIIELAL